MHAASNINTTSRLCSSGQSLYRVLFGPLTTFVAIPVLVLSVFLPSDGMGITICWFKRVFDLPCPGCGLTRSITCFSHFELLKAWRYHPFGFLIYGLFVANVVNIFLRKGPQARLRAWLTNNDFWLRPVYWILVVAFLTFGGIRLVTA